SWREMNSQLTAGLKAFQAANGLTADGIFGPTTWKHLNQNPVNQYRSLSINMHRARLLPQELGSRYLMINLPSAELFGFENGQHNLTMRVVHGKASNEDFHTPVFRDVMKEVVFAPYWNVPKSISVDEICPKLENDATYLERNRYEVVKNFLVNTTPLDYTPELLPKLQEGTLYLRQKAGPSNALGRVKFLFPNQFNIYLHDTPSKQYFARSDRAHSHGCIRLHQPQKMAEWTLTKQGWSEQQVADAFNGDERKGQAVSDPVNVYITYFTSFPRPNGPRVNITSARDVYNLDSKDARALSSVIQWRE
ncbi:MAG: L,D-transpeptidase family protein, partial [Verrucomicrobiota bacterium]